MPGCTMADARSRAASHIARCAIAAPSVEAWRMPTRPPTGRSPWLRSMPPSSSRAKPVDGMYRPEISWLPRSDPHGRQTRSSSPWTCRSSRRAARYGYYKLCRKTGEFPEASCGRGVRSGVGLLRAVLGALVGPPQALDGLASKLARQGASAATEAAIAEAVAPGRRGGTCRASDARRGGRARPQAGLRAMTTVAMTLNGAPITADVEPRTHLGDFLRDGRRLSGTHLGLRARRVRRMHGAAQRRAGALLHHPGGGVRRHGSDDDRRLRPTTTSWASCAKPSPGSTACNAASVRPAC